MPDAASAFHRFSARTLEGEVVSFERYRGQVVLVVNTASRCGLAPQLRGLEALQREFSGRGFTVLGFPCHQFHQERRDLAEIRAVCTQRFEVTFPLFAPVDVNGPAAHPLFVWLKDRLNGLLGRDIRWNFTKFLIARDGTPLERFAPLKPPGRLRAAVLAAVNDGRASG